MTILLVTIFITMGISFLCSVKGKIGQDLPPIKKPLNKWLLEIFGRMPKVEEKIQYSRRTFITRKVRRSNIYEVIIETSGV